MKIGVSIGGAIGTDEDTSLDDDTGVDSAGATGTEVVVVGVVESGVAAVEVVAAGVDKALTNKKNIQKINVINIVFVLKKITTINNNIL